MSSKVVAPRAIIEVTGGTLDVQMYDTEGDPPAGSRARQTAMSTNIYLGHPRTESTMAYEVL